MAEALNGNTFFNLPLIMDTGASGGLTSFMADFIVYKQCDIKLLMVAHNNTVKGTGTTMWKFESRSGQTAFLPQVSCHMPNASMRLFSPQKYFKKFGGSGFTSGM